MAVLAKLYQQSNWDRLMVVDPLSEEAKTALAEAQGVSHFLTWIDTAADRADEILTTLSGQPLVNGGQTGEPYPGPDSE